MKQFVAASIAAALMAAVAGAENTKMTVQVKAAPVRETPSFLGKPLGTLNYGDSVVVTEKPGDWLKVKVENPALVGWMHKSALTTKKIAVTSGKGDAGVKASSEELAMAGRGFDSEIEKEYRSKHADLASAYALVDKVEKTAAVTPERVSAFLSEGGVQSTEGKGQ